MSVDRTKQVAFSGKAAGQDHRRQRYTKRNVRATVAQLREQREARAAQRHDPDWVARYWKQVSGS